MKNKIILIAVGAMLLSACGAAVEEPTDEVGAEVPAVEEEVPVLEEEILVYEGGDAGYCDDFEENAEILKQPFTAEVVTNENGATYSDGKGYAVVSGTVKSRDVVIWDQAVEQVYLAMSRPGDDAAGQQFYDHFARNYMDGNSVNGMTDGILDFNLGTLVDGGFSSTAISSEATNAEILAALDSREEITLKLSVPMYEGRGAPANFSFACMIDAV